MHRLRGVRSFPPVQAIEGIRSLEKFYSLAAAGQVSVDDFDKLHSMALDSLRTIADIARSYSLTDAQENSVREAIARIEGMTVPMSQESTGTPWWYWLIAVLAGAGVGAGLMAAFSTSGPSHRAEMGRAGPFRNPSDTVAMLATAAGGSVVGLTGYAFKDSALGTLAMGAGSSVVGVSLTLLLKELLGGRRLAA